MTSHNLTATITSTKGTYTGTVDDCLAWQTEQQGAMADLEIGEHTLRLGDEIDGSIHLCYAVLGVSIYDANNVEWCVVSVRADGLVGLTSPDGKQRRSVYAADLQTFA